MNLTDIRRVLAERGLAPNKRFGQNFLHDQNLCRWIAAALELPPGARVLEVGPGLGALTEPLLDAGVHVTAMEIDRGLAAWLRERFAARENFRLLEGDALEAVPAAAPGADAVTGNLPYNISTPLLMTLLGMDPPPARMVFTLQLETAERLAAAPSTPAYGAVSVVAQALCSVRLLRRVPPDVFFPEPEVTSALVRLDRRPDAPGPETAGRLRTLVRTGFSQRRKMALKLLGGVAPGREAWARAFAELGLDAGVRAGAIPVERWVRLAER